MKSSLVAFIGLAATANAAAEKKPDSPPPAGCSTSYDGKFQVSIYSLGDAKRDLQKRACGGEGTLIMTLHDGVLKDAKDRTGSIVANYQFQFDGPPQDNAIYTAGFSVCNNGSLALGGSTVFQRCLSGSFYNLYDRNWAAQCQPIEMVVTSCDAGNNPPSGGSGGKPVGTSMVPTAIVTVLPDGQPQVHSTVVPVPMCQIGDGQVQAHTTPCAAVPPVSQISDGQPQAPKGAPALSQISDGQIQAPTARPPPVSQIADGQPQAPTKAAAPAPPVSQISDGQPQAPKKTDVQPPPVSQISDGQPQAPKETDTQSFTTSTVESHTTAAESQKPTPTAAAHKILPGLATAAIAVIGLAML
ncbi:hypothetical protein UVI_02047110 [Ustilaginoidea virens]|nr:hypothetical protein UVI_02047110 [Ustilaginoidea virens]